MQLTVQNRNTWIMVISFTGLILILLVLFFMQRNRRKVQAEKDAAIIKEREKGIEAIFAAQEEERSRIAKDLHDGIGQLLTASSMYFKNLSDKCIAGKKEQETFRHSLKILNNACYELRNISHQMMPKSLTESGIVVALSDLLNNIFEKSGISHSFETFNLPEEIDRKTSLTIYRITQELINNIIKHSKAKNAFFQLFCNKEHLVLLVEDDGKGLPDHYPGKGMGLKNMQSRAAAVHGSFEIENSPGGGVIARVRIPLSSSETYDE